MKVLFDLEGGGEGHGKHGKSFIPEFLPVPVVYSAFLCIACLLGVLRR
jgi:hypothetical protein